MFVDTITDRWNKHGFERRQRFVERSASKLPLDFKHFVTFLRKSKPVWQRHMLAFFSLMKRNKNQ